MIHRYECATLAVMHSREQFAVIDRCERGVTARALTWYEDRGSIGGVEREAFVVVVVERRGHRPLILNAIEGLEVSRREQRELQGI